MEEALPALIFLFSLLFNTNMLINALELCQDDVTNKGLHRFLDGGCNVHCYLHCIDGIIVQKGTGAQRGILHWVL